MMNYTFASATILLVLITDPVGNIPVFANALKHVAPQRRAKVILREISIAFLLLLTFMFVGEGFLRRRCDFVFDRAAHGFSTPCCARDRAVG